MIYLDDPLKRDFYIELCRLEGWSSRQLQERIQSMLFERSSISRQPEETIRNDLQQLRRDQKPSPILLLKDPYILDFLDLNDRYLEKDLEDAILREIEQFLLELGAGFTFVARQKRLQIDAPEKNRSRSDCWNWTKAASMSPNTSPCYRRVKLCRPSCANRSNVPANACKFPRTTPDARTTPLQVSCPKPHHRPVHRPGVNWSLRRSLSGIH